MARAAAIGNSSWVLPVRIAQLVFAILVFSLASYTLDKITGWKEVRFTVAAGVWAFLSLIWIMTSGMIHRPFSHAYLTLALEFINWGMFFAIWIALSVNIGKHQECVAADGGHSHLRECNTIYTALAFAIVDWILFSVTFGAVGYAIVKGEEVAPVHEKNTNGASNGATVRPSDDGTLRGENAA